MAKTPTLLAAALICAGMSLAVTVERAVAQDAPARPVGTEDCVWGQKGYRDCVAKLLAQHQTLDPAKALQNSESRTRGSSPAEPSRSHGRRRPGAGSLTPTAPAELRITPPTYDPAQDAIASERRQRSLDDNLSRVQRDAVTPPIMPPVINPPNGRICPAWGC